KGDKEPEVRPLGQVEGPCKRGDGLGEVALAQGPKAHGPRRHDLAIGVIGSLSKPYPFLSESLPLAKGAALSKGSDKEAVGEHGGQPGQTEALLEEPAVETHHVLL